MTIAEQITRAKADLEAVYEAGKKAGGGGGANVLEYATTVSRMFYGAAFPDGHKLVIDMPNSPTNIQEMFRVSYGLKKLTMKIPTNRAYNAQYFLMGHSTNRSTLEELVLPDGIKFSNFMNFANRAHELKIVNCGLGEDGVGIDLSESTSNENCFDACDELVEVRFKENTITMSVDFVQSSKLSDASIESIINGLAVVSEKQELILHATVKDKLTESQIAIITQTKGWTLA